MPSFLEGGSSARYANVCKLLPASATSQLGMYLLQAGSPEQAVLQMEVLLQRHPSEAISAFESSALALRSCVLLFGASQWLGQTLLQHPDLLQGFARPMGLAPARRAEDFREQFSRFRLRFHALTLPVLLARFKRREYVRIFTRELLGLSSLAEVTREISALSDLLIEVALTHCESELRRRYLGWPQLRAGDGRLYPARFSVLSLGKLGGNELNYSSDIDLLYLCDDAEDAGAISITAREFFTRLAQELTAVLSDVSADGQAFRVDLRLRPQGASGEIVTGYGQALRYYRSVAHDWELQSLLKLRPTAGDRTLAREFIELMQELIYCKRLSLTAVQTAARSLERIQRGVARRGSSELDVKNGIGGLREIEFVVQCLQRVHGGSEPWLRSSGTLSALQKLHDKGHVGDSEFRELFGSYSLLRCIEHRLQCSQGVQSHRLPETAREQVLVFRALAEGTVHNIQELKLVMKSTAELCSRVLSLGAVNPTGELAAVSVNLGTSGTEQIKRDITVRSATLAEIFAADVGDPTLRNVQRFLAAASTGEDRTRTALRNVELIERAIPVFARSVMATNILARNPEDIDALFEGSRRKIQGTVSDQLRIEARRRILRTVGQSILEETPVWEILGEHSRVFSGILAEAHRALEVPRGFAIFALGRLGTCELDVVSDADLVFVRNSGSDPEAAERFAHSVVAMLSGYTREGSVIAVDTRLRPHGNEGELVSSTRQLAQYFESDAKAWETLAFSKLRLIAGAEHLASEVAEAVEALQRRFAASCQFIPELRIMRKRIADSGGAGSFKTSPGGLYDLDFLVGMLETTVSISSAGKQLPQRLKTLVERGLLSTAEAGDLLRAGNFFRRVDHAVRVVEGRSRRWLPESDVLRTSVESIVGSSDLPNTLHAEMLCVRRYFDFFFRN